MKKLKLKALKLGANEVLSRTQLKNIFGGSGSGSGSGPGSTCSATAVCMPYNVPEPRTVSCTGVVCYAKDGVGATCDPGGGNPVTTQC